MKYTIQRRKTVPIPWLEFTSTGWFVGIEWDEWQTYEELSNMVEELEKKEMERKVPEYLESVDKLATLKYFLSTLMKDKAIWPKVRTMWQEFQNNPNR